MTEERLGLFGVDPLWLVIAKAVFVFAFLVVMTLFTIWWERRVVGRMQHRIGPNRNGPFGLLQSLADGVKLALKEDIIPKAADVPVYVIAPIISATTAFLAFAVIPFGPEVSIAGNVTPLQLIDFPVGVLYVLAITSIGVYGLVLAGWSSGSTYPLLGGLRSGAQVISYEISMGLSFVAVFLYAGSMSTSEIVAAQDDIWFAVLLLPSFLIYVTSMVGETNRAPFDLPEAEGELVGGFHTEYSSLKFALFFLAEYVNMITVSALAATLFLGGWRAPAPITWFWEGANTGWWPMLWFVGKLLAFLFLFIWLRGTLPRLRYDQFMKFGWKFLIPVSLVWIIVVATARAINAEDGGSQDLIVIAGVVLGVILIASVAADVVLGRRERTEATEESGPHRPSPTDPVPGGFPVPPMPGAAPAAAPGPTGLSATVATTVRDRSAGSTGDDEAGTTGSDSSAGGA